MKKVFRSERRFILNEVKNVILLIITVIDLIFIFLSTMYSFNFRIENLFADYDFLVCVLLFIDLMYEFYLSNRSIKEFFIDDKNVILLISLFPFDLLFRYFSIFRLFKFIKLVKIVRVWNVKKDMDSLVFFIQNHLLKLLFIILVIYVVISSVLLIVLDDAFTTLGDAFWFIVITTSTVGYGDITPVSPIGKSLTILTILIGIIFVSIFTAYLSAVYNEKPEMETRETIKNNAKLVEDNNRLLHKELGELNEKISRLEDENSHLKEDLHRIEEKIDRLNK
ncbi:MAG: hypothetical protein BZ136_08000 [Methanosphaera sp. rholeuAM74]|nr:MAG: hypothetical protein BZ136_08000 [Methanosphaera sp. rholeuAM74]